MSLNESIVENAALTWFGPCRPVRCWPSTWPSMSNAVSTPITPRTS